MGLESVTYISDLVATNPVGAVDPKSQGDDHIRNLKKAILASFPAITGAVAASHTELNYLDGATGVTGTGNTVRSASPTFTGTVGAAAITATGTVTGNLFSGSGASLTALNASNLASGTVPDARFPSTLPALNGSALTSLNASNLASGTVSDGRLSANVPLLNASNSFTGATQTVSASTARAILTSTGAHNAIVRYDTSSTVRGYIGADVAAELVTGAAAGDLIFRAESGGFLFSGNGGTTVHFKLSSSGVVTTPGASASEVGWRGTPVITDTAGGSYSVPSTAAGKTVYLHYTGGSTTATITDSDHPVGTIIRFVTNTGAGGAATIAVSGSTLYLAGTAFGTSGNRTLANGGVAVVEKTIDDTGGAGRWICSGVGVS